MLNLKQRVPLDEKNLHNLFLVMLEIAEEQKSFFLGPEGRIFIIIDGLDHLVKNNSQDENRCEDLVWLPQYFNIFLLTVRFFPETIKVILTCNTTSKNTLHHLDYRSLFTISLPGPHQDAISYLIKQHIGINKLKQSYEEIYEKLYWKNRQINNYISFKLLLNAMYPKSEKYPLFVFSIADEEQQNKIIANPQLLFQEILSFYQDKIFPRKFTGIWKTLSIALLGFSLEDLALIHDMNNEDVESFLGIFNHVLIKSSDNCWRVRSTCIQTAIFTILFKTEDRTTEHHHLIARALFLRKKITAQFVFIYFRIFYST